MTRQEFRWPPPVLPGEVVAVAAPASHVSRPPWEAGMNILRDWGFEVRCGPEVFEPRAYGVATDRLMARRFRGNLAGPGGQGRPRGPGRLRLPEARCPTWIWRPWRAHLPKRLVGFSDLTNLLWDLHRRLKLVTFHGPNLAQLPDLTPAAREEFYAWLTAPGPPSRNLPGPHRAPPRDGRGPPGRRQPHHPVPPGGHALCPPNAGLSVCSWRTTTKRCTAWTACSTTCSWPGSWTGSKAWSWGVYPLRLQRRPAGGLDHGPGAP